LDCQRTKRITARKYTAVRWLEQSLKDVPMRGDRARCGNSLPDLTRRHTVHHRSYQRSHQCLGDSGGAMDTQFFEKPILNSLYAYPARHWELDQ
jgi:hypothetical protein